MNFSIINISQFFVMKRSCTFSAASLSSDVSKASDKIRGVFFWPCLSPQLYLFKRAAAKWLRTRAPSEMKVAAPAHSCRVSLYTVLCPKEK